MKDLYGTATARASRLSGLFEPATVVLFAGLGGACIGIEQAYVRGGYKDKYIDLAVNHWETAVRVHELNHPMTQHLHADVLEVDPNSVLLGRKIAYLHASPDCFPAGTMILTESGCKPIESVNVGELVLTHEGRWRPVTAVMTSQKPTIVIRGQGHYGIEVSREHPFFCRPSELRWDGNSTVRRWLPSDWVKAGDLRPNAHYWATPTVAAALPVPPMSGRRLEFTEGFWWMVGRYLADGWSRIREGTGSELVLCVGKKKADIARERLNFAPVTAGAARAGDDELRWGERETRTEIQFVAYHGGLVRWLRDHFGHLAQNKRVPGWVLGLDESCRRALLEGYFAGDGHQVQAKGVNVRTANSVSKALAVGIRLLVESLGYRASLYFVKGRPTTIEGRYIDNVRDSYSVRWRVNPERSQSVCSPGHAWSAVREVSEGRASATLYNLSVEEDESYVADGLVVHNCTDFSKAKGGAPKRKHIRALADVVLVWAGKRRPDVITLENVSEFEEWGPLIQKPAKQPSKAGGWLWQLTRKARQKQTRKEIVAGPHVDAARADAWIAAKHRRGWTAQAFMMPDPQKRGTEFQRWKREFKALGYSIDHRRLQACKHGTPTTRERFFVIARCDGKPIIWPEPTHGPASDVRSEEPDQVHCEGEAKGGRSDRREAGRSLHSPRVGLGNAAARPGGNAATGRKAAVSRGTHLLPYHTAAECIDWSQPMLSIFATRAEAKAWAKRINQGRQRSDFVGIPQRPLKIKTQKRLAGGAWKWVLTAKKPFVTTIENYGWGASANGRPVTDPLSTVTAGPRGGKHAVVDVELAAHVIRTDMHKSNASCHYPATEPLTTVTGAAGHAAVGVQLASFSGTLNHGGPEDRTADLRQPMSTVTGANDARGVVGVELAPHVVRVAHGDTSATGNHRWGDPTHSAEQPLPTVSASKDFAIAGVELSGYTIPRHGEREGQAPRSGSIENPLPAVTSTANGASLVAVALNKHFTGVIGQPVDAPLGTVTSIDHHSVLAVHLTNYHGAKGDEVRGQSPDEPLRTLDTENRYGVVAAHVVKFRGESPGTAADAPMDTITAGSNSERPAGAGHAMGMAAYYLSHMYSSSDVGGQGDPRIPIKSVTGGGNHAALVAIYVTPYYGEGSGKTGHSAAAPLPTVPSHDRFSLIALETCPHFIFTQKGLARAKQVATWIRKMLGKKVEPYLLWVLDPETGKKFPLLTVTIDGALRVVADILMRMFKARELARAQGFPDWYVIERDVTGKIVTKADQVKLIGNSVPPQLMDAIAYENVVKLGVLEDCAAAAMAGGAA